ncbi:hypothetical protein [Lactobacillus delbrueckii]|uniref:hypothetical protein n=1 Tax=Lactobacillus delbrueckii TaxID=1584 RepID=UPI0022A71230|nr:hypothetical protein [Lactobacillus delbrueckii]
MFYSLIMALIMLALGIVSFWGRNQGSFEGLLPAGWQAYRLQPAFWPTMSERMPSG